MSDRQKLIELISDLLASPMDICREDVGALVTAANIADHLIANGVKVVGTETDLTGKCGSCAFAKPVRYCRSTSYVECTNEDLLRSRPNRGAMSAVRARTTKGCKRHTPMQKED